MRALFWINCRYTEFTNPHLIAHTRNQGFLEVTGDLEDELAAAKQFYQEENDHETT